MDLSAGSALQVLDLMALPGAQERRRRTRMPWWRREWVMSTGAGPPPLYFDCLVRHLSTIHSSTSALVCAAHNTRPCFAGR